MRGPGAKNIATWFEKRVEEWKQGMSEGAKNIELRSLILFLDKCSSNEKSLRTTERREQNGDHKEYCGKEERSARCKEYCRFPPSLKLN